MTLSPFAQILAVGSLTATAAAQLTAIPPFSGPHREGFETQAALQNQLYMCLPGRIFNNTADICEPANNTLIMPGPFSWTLFCTATPRQGTRYVVGIDGPLEITFDAPVRRFGGYFATIGGFAVSDVIFFNGTTTIGTVQVTTASCAYVWAGWESTTPFTKVRVFGDTGWGEGGGYIHMDDLEYAPTAGGGCYANCDGSTAAPTLNVSDFGCFLTRYAAGESYANCDGSTAAPILNVSDFGCFLTKYAAGCP